MPDSFSKALAPDFLCYRPGAIILALSLALSAVSGLAAYAQSDPGKPPHSGAGIGELAGTWGITKHACSPTNAARDGVVRIGTKTIELGLDTCAVTAIRAAKDGYRRFDVACRSGEDPDARPTGDSLFFALRPDGKLRWDNRRFSRIEKYVRCD